MIAADELVAVTSTVKFRYDDGKTFLNWVVGEDVSPAVWISVFLILVTIINMFPVKVRTGLRSTDPNDKHAPTWYSPLLMWDCSILESSNTYLEVSS